MQPSNRDLLEKLYQLQQEAIAKHRAVESQMATLIASGVEPDWTALWPAWEQAATQTQRIGDTLGLVAKLAALGKGSA